MRERYSICDEDYGIKIMIMMIDNYYDEENYHKHVIKLYNNCTSFLYNGTIYLMKDYID